MSVPEEGLELAVGLAGESPGFSSVWLVPVPKEGLGGLELVVGLSGESPSFCLVMLVPVPKEGLGGLEPAVILGGGIPSGFVLVGVAGDNLAGGNILVWWQRFIDAPVWKHCSVSTGVGGGTCRTISVTIPNMVW